jgi:hypothetical protein
MKKGTIFILLIVFLVFISTKIVFAFSPFGGFFGGKIINMKAPEIASLEDAGYVCPMLGTSISIIPIGSPLNTPNYYFIPSYVIPKTRTTPTINQLILGKYGEETVITCTLPSNPPEVKTVMLKTIDFFGTSRF